MLYESEMFIDEKRYGDIIRLGLESARRNIDHFELKYSCTFLSLDPEVKKDLEPNEYDEWRISCLAVETLGDKVN